MVANDTDVIDSFLKQLLGACITVKEGGAVAPSFPFIPSTILKIK